MIAALVNPPDGRTFEAAPVETAREGGLRAALPEAGLPRAAPDPTKFVPNDIEPLVVGKEAPMFQALSHAAAPSADALHPAGQRPAAMVHIPTRLPPSSEAGEVFSAEIAGAAIPTRAAGAARPAGVAEFADNHGDAAAVGALPATASEAVPLGADDARPDGASAGDDRRIPDSPTDAQGPAPVSDPPGLKPFSALPAPQLQRIADMIGAAAAEPALLPTPTAPGPVRTMTIELHPSELGVVTVKLRLVGDELSVSLHASRPQTARLLKREEGSLSRLLAADGHRVEIAGIETAPPTLAPAGSPAPAGGTPAPSGAIAPAGGSDGRDTPSSNHRSGGDAPRGEGQPDRQPQPNGDDGDTAPRLRPGNIYV